MKRSGKWQRKPLREPNRHPKPRAARGGGFYLISCSRFSNRGELKKSWMVISKPSQIFLMVLIRGFLLLPLTMLLNVDCVIPHIKAKPLTVVKFFLHRSNILWRTASPLWS